MFITRIYLLFTLATSITAQLVPRPRQRIELAETDRCHELQRDCSGSGSFASPSSKEKDDYFSLVFISNDGPEITIVVPLNVRLAPHDLPFLPAYPRKLSISAAPANEEQRIMCIITPKLSKEERTMRRPQRLVDASGSWTLWFMIEDGEVGFDDSDSQYFLAEREVESYEFRLVA